MPASFHDHLSRQINTLHEEGLYKQEREITSPQRASIQVSASDKDEGQGAQVINFCANNYLGLADSPELIAAAQQALERDGFGMASVRFICGTHHQHRVLEKRLAAFLGMDDAILYSSCFDANGGLFETLFGPEDAIISDALNHASIIDGVRLCKASRYRYANNDMSELEARLKEADALVMVDDSHATGFVGDNGRGSHEYHDVMDQIDIITTTFGKALGGASGGVTAARGPIVEWLRQRSRPYLFSNSLAPPIVAATLKALDRIEDSAEARRKLWENVERFRTGMQAAGFTLAGAGHAIIPVMIGDARLAGDFANRLLEAGIYVIGFSYPVVPRGQARIRTQLSAAHTPEQIDTAVSAFTRIGREMGVIGPATGGDA